MSPRTGRPKANNPKRNDVKVRLDDEATKELYYRGRRYLARYCFIFGKIKVKQPLHPEQVSDCF